MKFTAFIITLFTLLESSNSFATQPGVDLEEIFWGPLPQQYRTKSDYDARIQMIAYHHPELLEQIARAEDLKPNDGRTPEEGYYEGQYQGEYYEGEYYEGQYYEGGYQGEYYEGGYQGEYYEGGYQGEYYEGGYQGEYYEGGYQGGYYEGGYHGEYEQPQVSSQPSVSVPKKAEEVKLPSPYTLPPDIVCPQPIRVWEIQNWESLLKKMGLSNTPSS